MSSPEPLCGALAGFTLMRFLVFYILANWFPKHRTARTSKLEYSGFVSSVLNNAEIECSAVSIDDIEPSKRIYLTVDGRTDYTIRTWDYTPIHYDDKGNLDSEIIRYTLFKSVKDELSSHGEEVDEGIIPIYWDNEEV